MKCLFCADLDISRHVCYEAEMTVNEHPDDGELVPFPSGAPVEQPKEDSKMNLAHTEGNAQAAAGDGFAIAISEEGGRAVAASGDPEKIQTGLKSLEESRTEIKSTESIDDSDDDEDGNRSEISFHSDGIESVREVLVYSSEDEGYEEVCY